MTRLLIVNPNTHEGVSTALHAAALASAPPEAEVHVVQARFGARYIAGEAAAAVAAHAALDAYAARVAAHGEPDVVLLGCFGDPGLQALRAVAGVPVVGLAEAAMDAAAAYGRYAVVTGGAAWAPMLERLARARRDDALAGVQTLERSGAELAADPAGARHELAGACAAALARWPDVRCVLLGGAALAGMAAPLARAVAVPVLDNVELALQAAWRAARDATLRRRPAEPGPWHGLSAELLQWLAADETPFPTGRA